MRNNRTDARDQLANRRARGRRMRPTGFAVLVLAAVAFSANVSAADSGSLMLTVDVEPIPVRSISVEVSGQVAYEECFLAGERVADLRFPNGQCNIYGSHHPIVVRLGVVDSIVTVQTSDMSAPGGRPWHPCDCVLPRTDQFSLEIGYWWVRQRVLSTPLCDVATFHDASTPAGCRTVVAGSARTIPMYLVGPASISLPVLGPWTHTVTWTATPL